MAYETTADFINRTLIIRLANGAPVCVEGRCATSLNYHNVPVRATVLSVASRRGVRYMSQYTVVLTCAMHAGAFKRKQEHQRYNVARFTIGDTFTTAHVAGLIDKAFDEAEQEQRRIEGEVEAAYQQRGPGLRQQHLEPATIYPAELLPRTDTDGYGRVWVRLGSAQGMTPSQVRLLAADLVRMADLAEALTEV